MKKRHILTGLATLFCGALLFANSPEDVGPKKSITQQLTEILSDNAIDASKKDVMATVLFKINEAGKIEVVEIDTERKDVAWFINRKLKGQRLDIDATSHGEIFVVAVRVTS